MTLTMGDKNWLLFGRKEIPIEERRALLAEAYRAAISRVMAKRPIRIYPGHALRRAS